MIQMSAFITFLPLDSIESETMRHNFYSCSLLISAAISQRKISSRVKRMISKTHWATVTHIFICYKPQHQNALHNFWYQHYYLSKLGRKIIILRCEQRIYTLSCIIKLYIKSRGECYVPSIEIKSINVSSVSNVSIATFIAKMCDKGVK